MSIARRLVPAYGEAGQLVLFVLVGALNTAVGYAVFAAFVLIGSGMTWAAIGSTILGALFNFRSTGQIVFGSRRADRLPRFLLLYAFLCGLDIGLLRLAAAFGVAPLAAQVTILPLLALASFLTMRRFVFAPVGKAFP